MRVSCALLALLASSCGGSYGAEATDAGSVGADAGVLDKPLEDGGSADSSPPADASSSTTLLPSHAPASLIAELTAPSLRDITISEVMVFNTTTGSISRPTVALRPANASPKAYEVIDGIGFVAIDGGTGSPPLGIWTFKSLSVAAEVAFAGAAAPILASASSIVVQANATINVGANGLTPGAGGYLGGTMVSKGAGCGGGGGSNLGGGGGAFGSNGGAGGTGSGGVTMSCPSLLTALYGGSGGGGGDDGSGATGTFGGGGGGALQLSAQTVISMGGRITAHGGGGRTAVGNGRNGAGGGSGGAIFLEAPIINVTGELWANGGGGGSCSSGTGTPCSGAPIVAENGSVGFGAASGSHCAPCWGGDGATTQVSAKDGKTAQTTSYTGHGGGGGGVGRIVIHSTPTGQISLSMAMSPRQSDVGAFLIDKTWQ